MKGQVSAEMLILLAVVVAIVAIAASYLMEAGERANKSVLDRSNSTLEKAKAYSKGDIGDPCIDDEDCKSHNCPSNRCKP